MTKSEIYKVAQRAVLNSSTIDTDLKLEVLKELMDREALELFTEERGDNE